MFYAQFILNPVAPQMDQTFLNALGGYAPGNISFKIKTIDKPKVDLTTVELNQYNRKRLIYTKTEYLPFTVKIHDSVDGSAVQFWKDYFTYYIGDSRPKTSFDYGSLTAGPTTPTFDYSSGWGLSPTAENTNFFIRLDLYSLFGGASVGSAGGTGQYQLTSYINPRITSIDFEQHDSNSSDLEEVSITFKYEAIQYNPIQQGVLPQFGFGTDGGAVDLVPPIGSTFSPSQGGGPPNTNQTYNALAIGQQPSQGLTSVIATPSPTPVNGAPPGYVTNQTSADTTTSDLTNSTSFIYSAVSSNAGLMNYGTT
jgi:hypothetical protein